MAPTAPERATRTRRALLAAGFELMMDRSIEGIPIDELIAKAGVAKGSFFNHFGDKEGFKAAIALQIRSEIEDQIAAANSGLTNPLERLAGGMREVTEYALSNRNRTMAMLRMTVGATASDYPSNAGVRADVAACADAKLIRRANVELGSLYWLGLCVAIITHVAENDVPRNSAAKKLRHILFMGLMGLGAEEASAQDIAGACARHISQGPAQR